MSLLDNVNNTQKNHKPIKNLSKSNFRYFKIGEITVQVESDLPFHESTFSTNILKFEIQDPGNDLIKIRHHFFIPNLEGKHFGPQLGRDPYFQIFNKNGIWIYIATDPPHSPMEDQSCIRIVAFFKKFHTRGHIYHRDDSFFRQGNSNSLFFVGPDQLFISTLLADREGCYFHSSGVNFSNNGFVFLGHSGDGKSTIAKLLKSETDLLCDDRIIIRKWPVGFKIYGTWSHGELSEVSPASVPLRAILFIQKDKKEFLVPLGKRKLIFLKLMECIVVPVPTAIWWKKNFELFDKIISEIPCYVLHFKKNGKASKLIKSKFEIN